MDLAVRTATEVDKIVERELTQCWLRPGEVLRLGCPPLYGHVGLRLGAELHVPYTAARETPKVSGAPPRWPVPGAVPEEDWTDDPALGYWAVARERGQLAVLLADHFAAGAGEARLTWTNQRLAVVYPAKLLAEGGASGPFTTGEEFDTRAVTGLDALHPGRSFPPRPVLRFGFADGSAVFLRDVLAPLKVARARQR
ncbi:hypothetical protein [Amycolatopsis samaneae]|uniref:Uncharacterized protein n=1 Tax=Amycolatopsis samaneae TaxID=664691 RepID=A0ABW5GG46_9PSEU